MKSKGDVYKLDERNHSEKSLLDQLLGLAWEIIDLMDEKQTPAHTIKPKWFTALSAAASGGLAATVLILLNAEAKDIPNAYPYNVIYDFSYNILFPNHQVAL